MLQYSEARERVEVWITLGENARPGAIVVVQGLELVGDRGTEKRVANAYVSFMEFYYHDFAGVDGIDGIDVIVGIVVIIIVSVSVTTLALGEGRVSNEGWKGGEGGGGFEVVHHFSLSFVCFNL